MRRVLDDYLLELILMDSLVFASKRHIPDAERIIQSFIPPGFYDRIIARYDALSEAWDDQGAALCAYWHGRAARKSSAWKRMMIERLLGIVCDGGCADCRGPVEVAALAREIAAVAECRLVFARVLKTCTATQAACIPER